MPENIYEKLRSLLDCHPLSCPPAPEINEILETLFTEEEATVALGLSFIPHNAKKIGKKLKLKSNKIKSHLESMANKGLVYAKYKNNEWLYALENMIFIFEHPFKKGATDPTINKLRPLWKKYFLTWAKSFKNTTPVFRVIPIQETIECNAGVLPFEKIYKMVDKSKAIGIFLCACRELEQNCETQLEACMFFDNTCRHLVERGFGRYITKEEAKIKLKEFNKAGYMHQVFNTQDRLMAVCNCCSCCCKFLESLKESINPRLLAKSSFSPYNNPDLCTRCGICADERCPMGAIEMIEGKPFFNLDRCIGCGLCTSGCPSGSMVLKKNSDIPEPPNATTDLMLNILQETDTVKQFLSTLTPMQKIMTHASILFDKIKK